MINDGTDHPYFSFVSAPGSPPDLSAPGFTQAVELLTHLLNGAETPNATLPPKPHEGFCRMCGTHKRLTFEHLPPQSTGNSVRSKGAPLLTFLESDDVLSFPSRGWRESQRGIGGYVLCADCNNFAGTKYVNEYQRFTKSVYEALRSQAEKTGRLPTIAVLDLSDWALGDIARLGLIQLMDVAVHNRLIRAYPDLVDVWRTPGTPLPSSLRLGLTLGIGPRARLASPLLRGQTDGQVLFSEVAVTPFSWTLGFMGHENALPVDRTADVSRWLLLGHAERSRYADPVELPTGHLDSPLPGDFRPGDQIPGPSASREDPDVLARPSD